MLGFVSVHIPRNTISNQELWLTYDASEFELVLLSASTLSNICQREYSLTVDATKKQLLSKNTVSSALHWWTSTKKRSITSAIAFYVDRNWGLREVQLAFDEVDSHFFSDFKSWFSIIGQGTTYQNKVSHTFEGGSWSIWANGWPHTWYYNW